MVIEVRKLTGWSLKLHMLVLGLTDLVLDKERLSRVLDALDVAQDFTKHVLGVGLL